MKVSCKKPFDSDDSLVTQSYQTDPNQFGALKQSSEGQFGSPLTAQPTVFKASKIHKGDFQSSYGMTERTSKVSEKSTVVEAVVPLQVPKKKTITVNEQKSYSQLVAQKQMERKLRL